MRRYVFPFKARFTRSGNAALVVQSVVGVDAIATPIVVLGRRVLVKLGRVMIFAAMLVIPLAANVHQYGQSGNCSGGDGQ